MQPRKHSLIETCLNTASGFVLSFFAGLFVYPSFGCRLTIQQNFWVTVVFTFISVARGYFWRRLFNWFQWRVF
jgi:hypothetical protein